MNGVNTPEPMSTLSLWDPEPGVLYTIDHTAQFAGLPRRHIVLYARHGFITPAAQSGAVGWYFTADAIRTLRRIAMLRALYGLDLRGVRLVLGLMSEIERLRGDRFSRG